MLIPLTVLSAALIASVSGVRTGKRFIWVETKKNYNDARAHCRAQYGTDLAVILNSNENTEAKSLRLSDSWIGLGDHSREGSFQWVDTSPFLYRNWAPGEPNNYRGGEDCTEIRSDGRWNDQSCADRQAFLCAKYPHSRNYVYVKQGKNYADATKFCQSEFGTSLATILSQNQNDEAFGLAKADVWIGMNDLGKENGWSWQSGAEKSNFDRWSPGEPNDVGSGEDCAELWRNKYWNDNNCGIGRQFLCDRGGAFRESGNFIYVTSSKSWYQANDYCERNFGTTLASINSGAQNDEARLLARRTVWFGLNDKMSERKWEFLDRSTVSFTNWAPGEPNNKGNEDCAEIYSDGRWNDENCGDRQPFLCNQPADDCFCLVDKNGIKVTCEEALFAHYQESTGLYWAWASPCSGGCSKLPDPLPFGWRRATDDEFKNKPNLSFFGYEQKYGSRVYSSKYPEVCAANIFDPKYDHCDANDFARNYVTNKDNGRTYETLIVHDSGFQCPGFTRSSGFRLAAMEREVSANGVGECADQCSEENCQRMGDNAVCSAHVDDLVDPSKSASPCRHVFCRDCSQSLSSCVTKCLARQEWFGDDLSCEETCREVGKRGDYRCFNNYS